MTVRVDVSGLRAGLLALPGRVGVATREGVQAGGLVYERAIKEQIRGGHPKGTKTGATPGSPPENVTGNLRRSVTMSPVHGVGLRFYVDVGPSADYGEYLEGGTSRMPAYPFVRPAVRKADSEAHAVIVSFWRQALRV